MLINVQNLYKIYHEGLESEVRALDGVSLTIDRGEFVAIIGASGSGKSTLMNILGCLDIPTYGDYHLDGTDITELTDRELAHIRNKEIGFIFQGYNLIPALDAYENVELPLIYQGISVWENIVLPVELDGAKVDEAYIQEVIAILGLEKKLTNLPNQLSGGQQQRVAIARALATKPAILLADEPTGNLDSRTSQDVLGLMKVTGQKFAQTIVMITHNEEIAQLADRIVRIEDGRIVAR